MEEKKPTISIWEAFKFGFGFGLGISALWIVIAILTAILLGLTGIR